ncbi:hypothetical protein PMAYCL1PPCAC_12331 [Pristionchus mayeri]|uniref:ZSWIM3 N-terminal domain-containing protein n=1 Tax=Pristionchus mayeri TaxID=1317129 RepID=A0AAN4ZJV2_9BILA|nr:hypothetical protein PMAYCL1PPCAC_12331 [Pristionchus mayeri]
MTSLGDSLFSTYHSLILSTGTGLPLQPIPLKTESLSYPSPTAPIAAQIPIMPSPSTMNTAGSTLDTTSSPPHPSALSINTQSSSIHLDAKFFSFEEFRLTLEEWMSLNFHPFRVASSEMLRESEGTLNETFRYRYIVYHCAHYGNPRRRGAGKRPNQNYLPCGCTANLRLNYSFTDRCLKITTLKIEHSNHELSAEAFAKCSIKLKKSPSQDTPVAVKKGKKRAASASTDDSGVGVSSKKTREEISRPSTFSPLPTPPSATTTLDILSDTTRDDDWIPAPPPNLPAPTPQRPPPYSIIPLLMQHINFPGNFSSPLFSFPPQPQMGVMHPSSVEAQFTFKFNEGPMVTPVVEQSTENKENNEFVDVMNDGAPSPQEYATLQPVKSECLTQGHDTSNIHHTIATLHNQLLNGDPDQTAARQAELHSLLAKWGDSTQTI